MRTSEVSRRSWMFLLLAGIGLPLSDVLAQGRDALLVEGRILSEGGAPIADAIVSIPRLRLSATTGETGRYRLQGSFEGAQAETLRVSRLGYRPITRVVRLTSGSNTIDVTLTAQAVALNEVVVTGTTGNQARRAQAALVSTIDAADIVASSPVSTVNELLYARTPGVSTTQGSGTSGANTRIDIRGQSSISLSNYPLVFVDGVRVLSEIRGFPTAPGGGSSALGGQAANALNDLNPADIESIEIVKGPAAATLYGADATAGVIQILTKKGRIGSQGVTHSLMVDYAIIDPNFTPLNNYGTCTAALVAPTSTNPLCRGQAVGAIVSDNVLMRNDVYRSGNAVNVNYSARGGGESFGYFLSAGGVNEQGTTRTNAVVRRNGRINVNWSINPKTSLNASFGALRNDQRFPLGDQNTYSYSIQGFQGTPRTVVESSNGILGGWQIPNMSLDALAAIKTENVTTRLMPRVEGSFAPTSWFTNRLIVGSDITRESGMQMYPRNDNNWYGATQNTGVVGASENNTTIYTVDYLGTISGAFRDNTLTSNLSFGSQWVNTVEEDFGGRGTGLTVNSSNLVSSATTATVSQFYEQSKSFGLLLQEQLGYKDRLFLQVGARLDRNSTFGSDVGSYFLPKAGLSWVISDEPFWARWSDALSTLRLRTAYGVTGRAPQAIAARQTFVRSPFLTDAGVLGPGVAPGSPGNPDLKPERGYEFEAGFDLGVLNDRVGFELTYFDKTTKDLLLSQPVAASSGFTSSPLVNLGQVTNTGLEMSLRAIVLQQENVGWDILLNANTLKNRVVSMGSVAPFITGNRCVKPGVELAAWCVRKIRSVDVAANRVIVSDTAELIEGQMPKFELGLNNAITLFRNFRIFSRVDGKYQFRIWNLTGQLRDRSHLNSGDVQLTAAQGGYSDVERLRHLGPYFSESTGASVSANSAIHAYITPADYLRLRELSASYRLPTELANRMRVSSASISVGATNLAVWTDYEGIDPEVSGLETFSVPGQLLPQRGDIYTLPPTRRVFTRLTFEF